MAALRYKGTAPAINDLIGGQVPVMFGDVVASLPLATWLQTSRRWRRPESLALKASAG